MASPPTLHRVCHHAKSAIADLTIITVCFNEAESIERTLLSVSNQTVRDRTQYVVVDGGSTDGTVDLIRNNAEQIDVFVSEPDDGIYDAMNKGASFADGDYLLFLNGGDWLRDVTSIEQFLESQPIADIVHGYMVDPEGRIIKSLPRTNAKRYLRKYTFPHQATFISRNAFQQLNGYDTSFRIAGDYDFFVRAVIDHGFSTKYLHVAVAVFSPGGIATRDAESRERERKRIHQRLADNDRPWILRIFRALVNFLAISVAAPIVAVLKTK